jgi:hypothetical protein
MGNRKKAVDHKWWWLVFGIIGIVGVIYSSSVFILFFSEQVFKIWRKFSYFTVPLMILCIVLTKTKEFAGCGMSLCIDRTFVIFFSGILYFILTIFITSISAIVLRARDKRLK